MRPAATSKPLGDAADWLPECCLFLGTFLAILGAKLWLIHGYGNPTPFYDQWFGEGPLIKAWLEGTLSPAQLFALHNEHRILFTRLLCLLLVSANRQWDCVLEMVAQAPLHAGAIAAFVLMAGAGLARSCRAALALFAVAICMFPFGWQNTLWGFQSQFYFSLLFGFIVIWLCLRNEAMTPWWWLGALLAFANLFSMASGIFPTAAVAGLLIVRFLSEREKKGKELLGAGILLAIVAFGVAITPHATAEDTRPSSTDEYFSVLFRILAWPCSSPWTAILLQAPLILLVISSVRSRVSFRDGRWFVPVVGCWCWIQAAMTAYKRCKMWEGSRYCDCWSVMLLVSFTCLCLLICSAGARLRPLIYLLAAIWLPTCIYGTLDRALNQLPAQLLGKQEGMISLENHLCQYIISGGDQLKKDFQHPGPLAVQQLVDSVTLRKVLPPNIYNPNPALAPISQESRGNAFAEGGCPAGMPPLNETIFGSYPKNGTKGEGSIALAFQVPRGTREVNLQVGGCLTPTAIGLAVKEHHGSYYKIKPALSFGEIWQTIPIYLATDRFNIIASDRAETGWLAFSLPTPVGDHAPGRWARLSAAGFLYFVFAGAVFLTAGMLLRTERHKEDEKTGGASGPK